MPVQIGTSGWQYQSWRGALYPKGVPQREWLKRYAEAFAAVEVNNTFYQLPPATTFEAWRRDTPGGFLFVLKMSRYLTHLKRLHDPTQPVKRFMERATRLGENLGPIL